MNTYKIEVTLNGKPHPKHPYVLACGDDLDDVVDKLYGFIAGVYLSGNLDKLEISVRKVGK